MCVCVCVCVLAGPLAKLAHKLWEAVNSNRRPPSGPLSASSLPGADCYLHIGGSYLVLFMRGALSYVNSMAPGSEKLSVVGFFSTFSRPSPELRWMPWGNDAG